VVPATDNVYDIIWKSKLKELNQCFIAWIICIFIEIIQISFSISKWEVILAFIPPTFLWVIVFSILYFKFKSEYKKHIENRPDFSNSKLVWTCWANHLEELKNMETNMEVIGKNYR
jgi:hypothetical protein